LEICCPGNDRCCNLSCGRILNISNGVDIYELV
jgi:hypothetical protein